MTEEVESLGGSRWEGARYRGAGWLARQATNTLSPGRLALPRSSPPRLRKKVPGSFERLSQRYAAVDLGQECQMGQLRYFKKIGKLYGAGVSQRHKPMARQTTAFEDVHPSCLFHANRIVKRLLFIYTFQKQPNMVARHALN